jgi:hypothetical protein
MSIKSIAAKLFANYITNKHKAWATKPSLTSCFQSIQGKGNTAFGKDHRSIKTFADFAASSG